jgi:hypothetical protein
LRTSLRANGLFARQWRIIRSLERRGHDTTRAYQILGTFETTQKILIGDRDRLQRQLDAASY